jgi:2-keto-4-pentenoate hydratase/2-oxohepta-3-ene-1,7-dioic acid hydratase in catechol pathway
VQGPVKKGSVLVTGTVPGTAMAIDNLKFKPGCVVGKAMETIDSVDVKTIEVAVGRL